MKATFIGEAAARKWLEGKKIPELVNVCFTDDVNSSFESNTIIFDFLFDNTAERKKRLANLTSQLIFVNAVSQTLHEIGLPLIRMNGWPGFSGNLILELVTPAEKVAPLESTMNLLGWPYQLVADTPGLVVPRMLAMIINEAYFSLGEGVSTRKEIDIAMTLGTNYPHGPFEWAELIGLKNIHQLLSVMAARDSRYGIAPALVEDLEKIK